jgi:hypothetical protein
MRHKIIGRGKVGWHSDGVDQDSNHCSSSGAGLEQYLAEAENGTPIYDAEDAEPDAYADLVICGPMFRVDLPPGTVRKFGEQKTMARMLPGLGGSFATIAKLSMAGVGNMDYVAVDVYLELLSKVPGIKIGTVQDHKVVWR